MLSFQHLLHAHDLTKEDIEKILELASFFHNNKSPLEWAKGKILASLFFEPSTRTRLSFESAMYRLGGNIITLENGGQSSSVTKGETLSDMGQIISGYADIVAMRHPKAHSVQEFSKQASIPVINAGDGPHQHPTQSLLDLYTIFHFHKRLNNLKIGFVGDLKFGRTVNSLVELLSLFPHSEFHFVSHPTLKIDHEKVKLLRAKGHIVHEYEELSKAVPQLDVLYMTRVQEERFSNPEDYKLVKDAYTLTQESLVGCKESLTILHPFPRVKEISADVDQHPAAKYFEQAQYGLFVRMAIIALILQLKQD